MYPYLYNGKKDFNPRSPCGERLGGSDAGTIMGSFQSTLPMRGATFFTPKLTVA